MPSVETLPQAECPPALSSVFSKAGELGDKNAIWYIKEYCK
jgi:hypothetical protein